MSYPQPTLTVLRNRIEADFNTRLPGADSRLRRSVLWVISYVCARTAWGLYGFLGWISRQHLPDTADDDQLARLGGIDGIAATAAATAAGSATVTGVNGSPIVTGTALQTALNTVYIVQADTAIVGTTGVVALRAAVAGAAGNQAPGTQLDFVSPVAGVGTGAVVITMGGGLDIEDIGSYRGRLLDHRRAPPQGGAQGNYVQWARSLPGCTRAWEVPDWQGAGTVGVLFVFDGRGNIFPLADDIAAMQALLNAKRPITTPVYAVAPTPNPRNFTIALNPSSGPVKAAVAAELADLLSREGIPGATVLLTHQQDAIGLAVGAGDYQTTGFATITQTPAQMATLGVITWAAWV
jgi:uncharacterized phage protein gp47/JayE